MRIENRMERSLAEISTIQLISFSPLGLYTIYIFFLGIFFSLESSRFRQNVQLNKTGARPKNLPHVQKIYDFSGFSRRLLYDSIHFLSDQSQSILIEFEISITQNPIDNRFTIQCGHT